MSRQGTGNGGSSAGRSGQGQSGQSAGQAGFSTAGGGGRGNGGEQGDGGGGGSFAGRGPRGYRRGDDRIGQDVCEVLTIDPDIDASDIDVIVTDGVVTLVGVVDDRPTKRRAEDLAGDVPGVRDVHNQLQLGDGGAGNGGTGAQGAASQGQPGQRSGSGGRSDDRGGSPDDRGRGAESARMAGAAAAAGR
jgi:hypothetical protein